MQHERTLRELLVEEKEVYRSLPDEYQFTIQVNLRYPIVYDDHDICCLAKQDITRKV